MARLLFVFLDGVGLGPADPGRNPLSGDWPGLRALARQDWTAAAWRDERQSGLVTAALDARLGIAGLPQSATGQATLLTGHNAAQIMGRHYGPWPGPTLQALLARGSLFVDGVASGGALLANAYPARYLTAVRVGTGAAAQASPAGRLRRARPSAAVAAALAAGLELQDTQAWDEGRAVAPELDAARVASAVAAPGRSGTGAGVCHEARTLALLAGAHAFTFFDVWSGDRAGHRQDAAGAHAFLSRLDTFLPALAAALPADVTLLVVSDHGNLEDLCSPSHTLAPVPLLALGPAAQAFAGARSLLDVAPAVRRVLAAKAGGTAATSDTRW